MSKLGFAAIALLIPALGQADVADSSPNGFTVKLALSIQAPPGEVYARLVHGVGDWWNSAHTFSNDAHNLSIDDKPMGCFCEKLPGGGGVRHMEVVNADPGQRLVLSGALGPLQSMAATGSLSVQLAPEGSGTKLMVVYAVSGYLPAGLNTWAATVDTVLSEQFTRLKSLVETGNPEKKKAAPR